MRARSDWEITPQDLDALRRSCAEGVSSDGRSEPPVLLDVRRHDEVAAATIAGAVHIPLDELEERVDELDPAKETIVYCHHGVRSLAATAFLRQRGFDKVKSLAGGIDRWSVLVDPSVPRYG